MLTDIITEITNIANAFDTICPQCGDDVCAADCTFVEDFPADGEALLFSREMSDRAMALIPLIEKGFRK